MPTRVPLAPGFRGARPWLAPETLAFFRWLAQKLALRQDCFVLAEPGPRARQLVQQFCEVFGREAELLSLTRDTCEADLKQRREIRGGALAWVDQAPVRAALPHTGLWRRGPFLGGRRESCFLHGRRVRGTKTHTGTQNTQAPRTRART